MELEMQNRKYIFFNIFGFRILYLNVKNRGEGMKNFGKPIFEWKSETQKWSETENSDIP